ncbi:MAG: T9SS type A sorting domain-containing protein, partial [Sphingobacteriales bacterium]|nr:T9SS type A sorting domain-containing protein [Sphingobacteriales bacterium]
NNSRLADVFPNPSNGKFTVKLNRALVTPGQILIKDITGRLVAQQALAAGQKQINLNLGQLAAGRYFLHIFNNGEWINESVLITK